jgi:hypothetical protein
MRRQTKWLLWLAAALVVAGTAGSLMWIEERSLESRYARIQPGMTYEEVGDLLGGSPSGGIGGDGQLRAFWLQDEGSIQVTFQLPWLQLVSKEIYLRNHSD